MTPPNLVLLESLAEQHRADMLREAERIRLVRDSRSHRRPHGRTRRRFLRWS